MVYPVQTITFPPDKHAACVTWGQLICLCVCGLDAFASNMCEMYLICHVSLWLYMFGGTQIVKKKIATLNWWFYDYQEYTKRFGHSHLLKSVKWARNLLWYGTHEYRSKLSNTNNHSMQIFFMSAEHFQIIR